MNAIGRFHVEKGVESGNRLAILNGIATLTNLKQPSIAALFGLARRLGLVRWRPFARLAHLRIEFEVRDLCAASDSSSEIVKQASYFSVNFIEFTL
jgi:hypothetical protein